MMILLICVKCGKSSYSCEPSSCYHAWEKRQEEGDE